MAKKNKMIYTPEHGIPMGEAVKTEDGEYGLRVKKAGSDKFEEISISRLFSQVAHKVEAIE